MPAARYPKSVRDDYVSRRQLGMSNEDACYALGISKNTGDRWWRDRRRETLGGDGLPPPRTAARAKMNPAARRALTDFVYFRRICFGHTTAPWALDAAETIREAVESRHRKFLVINVHPGVGKTVLLKDTVQWLICRDRTLRVIWGSGGDEIATQRTAEMRAELARTEPGEGLESDLKSGRSVKPRHCLAELFGRFKPSAYHGVTWSRGEFTVAQPSRDGRDEGPPTTGPTVRAFGRRSKQLGARANLIVWDDVWDDEAEKNPQTGKDLKKWFDKVAEERLEPNGVLVLVMQRMSANDLSRHCLDKMAPVLDEDGLEVGFEPEYTHIVYPAHHDDLCDGSHPDGRPAWDPRNPTRGNCITDPQALPPHDLVRKMRKPDWPVVYQQRDMDPERAAIREIWLTGGKDENGIVYPGCLDFDRGLYEPPEGIPRSRLLSAAAIDPGQENFWGLYWSLTDTDPSEDMEWVMAASGRRMPAGTEKGLLDWIHATRSFVGVMDEWQRISEEIGHPIRAWVVEINCAQRHLLRYDFVERWQRKHKVLIIPHECVDAATEVLSQRGWLGYGDIAPGDMILTLNMISGLAEWQPVQSVYRSLHDGPMLAVKTVTTDALVTPDHTWPVTDQWRRRPLRLVETQHLKTSAVIPLARSLAPEQEPEPLYSDDLVELVGWAVTEGHFRTQRSNYSIAIGQSERVNHEKCERIRALLKRLGAQWSERENGNGVPADQIRMFIVTGHVARAVRAITDNRKHLPPEFVAGLPAAQREILRDALVAGDGWLNNGHRFFCSNTQSLAGAFEMLCALDGRPTSRYVRPAGEGEGRWRRTADHYVVMERTASHLYMQNVSCRPRPVEDFRGIVWCPSTVNGTFYARRNGKTYFTGNTKRNKTDAQKGVEALLPSRYQQGAFRIPWKPGPTQQAMRGLYDEAKFFQQGHPTDDILMAQWMRKLNERRVGRGLTPVAPSEPPDIPAWVQRMA